VGEIGKSKVQENYEDAPCNLDARTSVSGHNDNNNNNNNNYDNVYGAVIIT